MAIETSSTVHMARSENEKGRSKCSCSGIGIVTSTDIDDVNCGSCERVIAKEKKDVGKAFGKR